MAIDLDAIIAVQAINAFFKPIQNDKNHRYKSWEFCYEKFQDAMKPKNEDNTSTPEDEIDELSLHLAFYLASWGMYRGSSFLLQKNYCIHKDPVTLLLKRKDILNETEQLPEALIDIWDELAKEYSVSTGNSNAAHEEEPTKMTDTLFTKIILGVYGCIPAFDRFYKTGVGVCNGIKKLNKEAISEIYSYWEGNKKILKEIDFKTQSGKSYPPMKLMDMCFFTIGMCVGLNKDCFEANKDGRNQNKLKKCIAKYYKFIYKLKRDNFTYNEGKNFLSFCLNEAHKLVRKNKARKVQLKTIFQIDEDNNLQNIFNEDCAWVIQNAKILEEGDDTKIASEIKNQQKRFSLFNQVKWKKKTN